MHIQKFSLWLLPCTQDSHALNQIIIQNIKNTPCPAFQAHITLFCGQSTCKKDLINEFIQLFKNSKKHKAQPLDPVIGEAVFKRYYQPFTKDSYLDLLHQKAQALDPNSTYQFLPHLSLFYGTKGTLPKAQQLCSFDTTQSILFDKIALVNVSST